MENYPLNLTVTTHFDLEIDYWAKLKEICARDSVNSVSNSLFIEEPDISMEHVKKRLSNTILLNLYLFILFYS